MRFYDFEYDGLKLSDMGYIVCKFGTQGLETITNGSQITFNTVPIFYGKKNYVTSAKYEECLEATFQICKNPCDNKLLSISVNEERDIMSWLNRKTYHKFKILEDAYLDLFFNSSFNISRIEMNGQLYGFELKMKTDTPFAYREPLIIEWNITNVNQSKVLFDLSDEEGFIYPETEIEVLQDGDFSIHHKQENRDLFISNCSKGEIIKLNYPEISSTGDKIQNRFNWNFLRIINTFKNKENELVFSLPCNIRIKYNPFIKVGI